VSFASRLAVVERRYGEPSAPLPWCAPVPFARQCGMEPDLWQERVLLSTAPRLLLNCSRQSGKSQVTALLALWTALFEPGSLVLLLSPSQRQSAELLRYVLRAYRVVAPQVPADAETLLRLELANGSRILALPGVEQTVRGLAGVTLLVLDEAARICDELYAATRPMLAVSGGRLVMLSTPWGRRGVFFEAWEHGDGWQRVQVTAEQCPRISAQFLAEERAALGPHIYAREYACEFQDADDAAFSGAAIARMVTDDPPLWTSEELALPIELHHQRVREQPRYG